MFNPIKLRILIAFLAGFIVLNIFAGATGICPFLHRLMGL